MRRALIWAVRLGAAGGVLAWVFYSADWSQVGREIAGVPGWAIAAAVALYGGASLIGALRLQMLLRVQGADCSFGFAFQLMYVGLCFNLALPGGNGGDVVKVGWATRITGSLPKSIAAAGMDSSSNWIACAFRTATRNSNSSSSFKVMMPKSRESSRISSPNWSISGWKPNHRPKPRWSVSCGRSVADRGECRPRGGSQVRGSPADSPRQGGASHSTAYRTLMR